MGKKIFEGKTSVGPHRGHAAGDSDVEKAASQLVSDIKYKVRKEMEAKGGRGTLNPAQVAQKYREKWSASSAPGAVKAIAKKKLMGEEYDISKLVQESIVSALNKVFVEGIEKPVASNEYLLQLEEIEEKKYKIRVTDKKTGNSYVRMATRTKIAELRANPNISSVEMTNYGEPSESEKTKGEKTTSVKTGKGLNNDGNLANNYPPYDKVTRGDIIAGATGKDQMGGKRKVKEEFIGEEGQDQNTQKLDIRKKIKNKVDIFPDSKVHEAIEVQNTSQPSALQQFQQQQKPDPAIEAKKKQQIMLQKKIEMDKVNQLNKGIPLTQSYNPEGESIEEVAPPGFEGTIKRMKRHKEIDNPYALAWYMKNKGYKSHRKASGAMKEEACGCEDEKEPKLKKSEGGAEDPRSMPTMVNLAKNKLRAMGLKMDYEPEGELIGEEDYDRMKDTHLQRGGMGIRASQSPAKIGASKPVDPKKHAETSKKALELIRQKYKGSLM